MKIHRIFFFAIFFFFLNNEPFFAKDKNSKITKAKIYETSLPFVPKTAGSFFSEDHNSYYALEDKLMMILDENFKIKSSITFSSDVSAFDFGDINGDKLDDLIELTPNGIYVRYQVNRSVFGNRKKLPIRERLFSPHNAIDIERLTLGYDIDNDSDFDIVVPGIGRFFYYENVKQKWVKRKDLPYEFKSVFSDRIWKNSDRRSNTITAKSFVPRLYFQDFNNDGVIDAYCRVKAMVYFYASQNNNPFENISVRVYPVELEDVYASYFEVADLNDDKQPDLIFSIIKGLGLKIRTEVFIFWGENNLPNPKNKIFYEQQGGFFAPLLAKFKSKNILIMPTIDLGVGFFINYIVRRKLSISAKFFSVSKKEMREETSVSLSFDVEGNLFPGFTVGDYNNDSYSDFILGQTLNELEIYNGNDDFDVDAWLELSLPSYGILKTIQTPLKRDELFIYLPQLIKEYDRKKIFLVRFE
ncbi:MAG: VCBS repeat-containing protein [Spirochaetia bacterium]|nr:VCBS repeat-containing protein [Spirochaetia bacterium]